MFLYSYKLIFLRSLAACGGSITTPRGVLQSPYYPDPYPGNRECVYSILAPEGYLISLTFVMVDIESGMNGCNTDYLEVNHNELVFQLFFTILLLQSDLFWKKFMFADVIHVKHKFCEVF